MPGTGSLLEAPLTLEQSSPERAPSSFNGSMPLQPPQEYLCLWNSCMQPCTSISQLR
jgi:hypothetical protein